MFGFEMEDDQILKQLTKNKSGILYSLNDLEKSGKTFLYSCIHLLYSFSCIASTSKKKPQQCK